MQAQSFSIVGFIKSLLMFSSFIVGDTPSVFFSETERYNRVSFFSNDQNRLASAINGVSLTLGEDVTRYVTENRAEYLLDDYNAEMSLIKSLLPQVLPEALLIPVLEDPTLSIMVTSQTGQPGVKGAPDALYQPWSNTLRIVADSDINLQQMRAILRNEFEHVATRYKNVQLNQGEVMPREAPLPMIWPTMTAGSYQSDEMLSGEFSGVIKKGYDRASSLKSLVQLPSKALSMSQKNEVKKFEKALKNYEPEVFRESVPKTHESMPVLEKMKLAIYQNGVYVDSVRYIREIFSYRDSYILKYTYNKDNHWRSKATALFVSLTKWKSSVDSGAYRVFGEEHGVAELSSFLHELPGELSAFIFPEWCHYFDEYHEVEAGTYCSSMRP